jgi:hypothetical protein
MFGKLVNPARFMALILSIMACALPAQSGAQDSDSLDAIERRLLEHYRLREGNVAMRDVPGWAPLKKIVVRDIYGPGSLGTTAARLDWISKVAPGVEFVAVDSLQEAIDKGLLLEAQAVIGIGCSPELIFAFGPEVQWTQSSSSGVEGCFFRDGESSVRAHRMMMDRNIVLTNQSRTRTSIGSWMAGHC